MRYTNMWMNAQITQITAAAKNVRFIEFMPETPYRFSAGSHIDVIVYIDGEAHLRTYSLVGTFQAGKAFAIGVKKLDDSRGGSEYMCSLQVGSTIRISQPKNHFEMTYGRDEYLLIAGGIGITPLIGMAQELIHQNAHFRLLYAGASRAEMPFIAHLSDLLGDKLSLHISDEDSRLGIAQTIQNMSPKTQVYACGPMRMLDDLRQVWHDLQLPESDLRYETFGTTGRYPTQAFTVKLPRFGKNIRVARNQTLLDALNNNGIEVMSDCERGECGLCIVDILACNGTVDHRDMFFSEAQREENTKLCACVSRVINGDIVIDTAYRGADSLPIPDEFVGTS